MPGERRISHICMYVLCLVQTTIFSLRITLLVIPLMVQFRWRVRAKSQRQIRIISLFVQIIQAVWNQGQVYYRGIVEYVHSGLVLIWLTSRSCVVLMKNLKQNQDTASSPTIPRWPTAPAPRRSPAIPAKQARSPARRLPPRVVARPWRAPAWRLGPLWARCRVEGIVELGHVWAVLPAVRGDFNKLNFLTI